MKFALIQTHDLVLGKELVSEFNFEKKLFIINGS